MGRSEKDSGFTLLEVLVAVAVVAVLAAVIFPVFRSARDQAMKATWISNYRQVALGQTLYLGDYDDRFYLSRYTADSGATFWNDRTWVQLLLPYVTDFEL